MKLKCWKVVLHGCMKLVLSSIGKWKQLSNVHTYSISSDRSVAILWPQIYCRPFITIQLLYCLFAVVITSDFPLWLCTTNCKVAPEESSPANTYEGEQFTGQNVTTKSSESGELQTTKNVTQSLLGLMSDRYLWPQLLWWMIVDPSLQMPNAMRYVNSWVAC